MIGADQKSLRSLEFNIQVPPEADLQCPRAAVQKDDCVAIGSGSNAIVYRAKLRRAGSSAEGEAVELISAVVKERRQRRNQAEDEQVCPTALVVSNSASLACTALSM